MVRFARYIPMRYLGAINIFNNVTWKYGWASRTITGDFNQSNREDSNVYRISILVVLLGEILTNIRTTSVSTGRHLRHIRINIGGWCGGGGGSLNFGYDQYSSPPSHADGSASPAESARTVCPTSIRISSLPFMSPQAARRIATFDTRAARCIVLLAGSAARFKLLRYPPPNNIRRLRAWKFRT